MQVEYSRNLQRGLGRLSAPHFWYHFKCDTNCWGIGSHLSYVTYPGSSRVISFQINVGPLQADLNLYLKP